MRSQGHLESKGLKSHELDVRSDVATTLKNNLNLTMSLLKTLPSSLVDSINLSVTPKISARWQAQLWRRSLVL